MNGRLLRRRGRTRCRVVRPLLQSYVDGEAPDSAAFFVAAHLDDCRRCALDADAYRWLVGALARVRVSEDTERRARLQAFADELTTTA